MLTLSKPTLFAYALDLGATRSNDFTDQVTHLIADAPGSAKYRVCSYMTITNVLFLTYYQCAVERKLPILTESWAKDIHDAWLKGEEIDLDKVNYIDIRSGVYYY